MKNDNSLCKVRHIAVPLLMLVLAGAGYLLRAEQRPSQTQNGSGAFSTGRYRNLFAELGHSQTAAQAKVDEAYRQLFHGDPQTQAVFFSAGRNADGPLAYITDWANHDVRTEGMSYGMMIAVQMNKKAEFRA